MENMLEKRIGVKSIWWDSIQKADVEEMVKQEQQELAASAGVANRFLIKQHGKRNLHNLIY